MPKKKTTARKGLKSPFKPPAPPGYRPGPALSVFAAAEDLDAVHQEAMRRAARVADLDTNLMTATELPESIDVVAPDVGQALKQFLNSLNTWFSFHRDTVDHRDNLSQPEKEELVRLIQLKETARAKFVALVAEPPHDVARAWMNDVLIPIRDRLAIEIQQLEGERWTWRFHLEQCELIGELSENAEPILRSQSYLTADFRKSILAHDTALSRLLSRLREACASLLQDRRFVDTTDACLAEHHAKYPQDKPTGAFPQERIRALAAQFVLNNVEEVSPGESSMEVFWNEHRNKIRAIVDEAQLRAVKQAGIELLKAARLLQRGTEKLIDRIDRLVASSLTPTHF